MSDITATTITVQWEEIGCSEENGVITGYSVEYWEVEAGNGSVMIMTLSGDTATISSLIPSTTYSIRVAAENSAGTGPYSNALYAVTDGMQYHFITSIVKYTYIHTDTLSVLVVSSSTTYDSLTISWTLADGLTATTDYTISYSNTDTECFNISYHDITTSQTMYTLTGLEVGTDYSITVTVSLSDGGTGEDSLTATTETAG